MGICNHEKLERNRIASASYQYLGFPNHYISAAAAEVEPIGQTPFGMSCLFCSTFHTIKHKNTQPRQPNLESSQNPEKSLLHRNAPSLLHFALQEIIYNHLTIETLAITLAMLDPDTKQNFINMLIDQFRMNTSILELLLEDSPTELRFKSCEWLKQAHIFHKTHFKSLVVLQLDNCRVLSMDSVIFNYFPKSPNSLPCLRILSLRRAKFFHDHTLEYLLMLAPSLQSLNIGGCSKITSASIETLTDILKENLRELYIDDCRRIKAKRLLPYLKNIKHLEVLWMQAVPGVCDDFVIDLMTACGNNFKELNLAECGLTNRSMEAIGHHCPHLCSLDISISNITELGLCHIANGCRSLTTFKIAHNHHLSDEAVAAFVEVSGGSLLELSLDGVRNVSYNTALALAKYSRKLISLDLSRCDRITNEELRFIVNSCSFLRLLTFFGDTQVSDDFPNTHSNSKLIILGVGDLLSRRTVYFDFEPTRRLLRYSPLDWTCLP